MLSKKSSEEYTMEDRFPELRLQRSGIVIRQLDDQLAPQERFKWIPQHPFAMAIFGPPGCGKSTLLSNMLRQKSLYKKVFHRVYIMSPSARFDDKMSPESLGLPDKRYSHAQHFDLDFLQGILESQSKLFDANLTKYKGDRTKARKKMDRVLIIVDDLAGDQAILGMDRCDILKHAIMNRRHYGVSIVFSFQRYKAVCPMTLRNNIDAVVIFNLPNASEVKAVKDEQLTDERQAPIFDQAIKIVRDLGTGHFMMIDKRKPVMRQISVDLNPLCPRSLLEEERRRQRSESDEQL